MLQLHTCIMVRTTQYADALLLHTYFVTSIVLDGCYACFLVKHHMLLSLLVI